MKKFILFLMIIFTMSFAFGQKATWDNWGAVSCYQGFQSSAINYGFNKYGNGYEWNWKIKSNYNRKVSFNVSITIGNDKKDWGRFTLSPDHNEHAHVSFYYNSSSTNYKIEITEVCFSDNYLDNCYAECDNGTPNQPICNKNTNSNSTSNSNINSSSQQTQPQNDLSEYNRSKADLERQMNEKNAEGQRQNQENANKLNIWNNAIKAGVAAHNSGNYTEAKNQFSIAINNSTNESNSQNAQNYYNKSVDAEKSQGKIKAVGDLVQGTLQILGDAHERKMQKLNAEIDELKSKNAIVDEDQKINTLNDPKIFETYCDYLAKNLEKTGFVFEKLEKYTNIDNKEKTAFLKFKGIKIYVQNRRSYEKMLKYVTFIADNQNEYQKLINSTFFINLSQLNPNYNKSYSTFDNTNISTIGLEKQEDFLNIYNQGYTSINYIGFTNLSKELDKNAQKKLKTMGNTTNDLLEKAKLFASGAEGITKNYEKSVEFYQNA